LNKSVLPSHIYLLLILRIIQFVSIFLNKVFLFYKFGAYLSKEAKNPRYEKQRIRDISIYIEMMS